MTHKTIVIPGRLPSLNDYQRECRRSPWHGNRMKQGDVDTCVVFIRQALRGVEIGKPVAIHYRFYEKNRRRDKMNVFAYADKAFQDALTREGVIRDDGWRHVDNATHSFFVDKEDPRVEVDIEELEN